MHSTLILTDKELTRPPAALNRSAEIGIPGASMNPIVQVSELASEVSRSDKGPYSGLKPA